MKTLIWLGSSKKDLREMPEEVRDTFGYALYRAQLGAKHPQARPLSGFGSAGILEVVENDSGCAYRAVYTVCFADAVYVLHCFQKKSTSGVATPKRDMGLIKARLKQAETLSRENTHE
ncbi:MAG: type II toxin-antitoxin system RelE/ParE family toxin [Desulfovibrio sp.]|jgi:phage-related protein|nr:type II toxin-antitoxin system RelE/ParE family toxin [Desulfovibrio sp.]